MTFKTYYILSLSLKDGVAISKLVKEVSTAQALLIGDRSRKSLILRSAKVPPKIWLYIIMKVIILMHTQEVVLKMRKEDQ